MFLGLLLAISPRLRRRYTQASEALQDLFDSLVVLGGSRIQSRAEIQVNGRAVTSKPLLKTICILYYSDNRNDVIHFNSLCL